MVTNRFITNSERQSIDEPICTQNRGALCGKTARRAQRGGCRTISVLTLMAKNYMKLRKQTIPSLFLLTVCITGCTSFDYERIANKAAYDQSPEKKFGMTEWEYKLKLERDRERFKEEQRQFDMMKNQ